MLKKVPVAAPNQTEPILVNKKKLEYKWGMNVLGELMAALMFAALRRVSSDMLLRVSLQA